MRTRGLIGPWCRKKGICIGHATSGVCEEANEIDYLNIAVVEYSEPGLGRSSELDISDRGSCESFGACYSSQHGN